MKNKVIAGLLVIIFIFSLSSCTKEPYQVYVGAVKKLDKAKSFTAYTEGTMSMSFMGEKMDMDLSANSIVVKNADQSTDMSMDMEMTLKNSGGQSIKTKTYYHDGYMYQDTLGNKVKIKMPLDQATGILNGYVSKGLTEDAIDSMSMENVDGKNVIKIKPNSQAIKEAADKMLKTMYGGLDDMGLGDIEYDYKDIEIEIAVDKNGMIDYEKVYLLFSMDIMGQTIDVSADIKNTYSSFDNVEAIDFPNFDEYKTMSK